MSSFAINDDFESGLATDSHTERQDDDLLGI